MLEVILKASFSFSDNSIGISALLPRVQCKTVDGNVRDRWLAIAIRRIPQICIIPVIYWGIPSISSVMHL